MASDERGASSTSGERLVIWTRTLGAHEAVLAFAESAASRFRVAGGELLAELGATLAIAFESFEAPEACQMALELLREAPGEVDCAMGAAFGDVRWEPSGRIRGEVVDRAQWLCHRGERGDLIVDDDARALLEPLLLFASPIGEEAGARRGHPVDRAAPTLPECRAAVAHLRAPTLPASYVPFADTLAELARSRGGSVLLVRGSAASLLELPVEHVAREFRPARVLSLGAVPFGLEPLGSLRYGLARLFPLGADLDHAASSLPENLRAALDDVRAGRPVDLAVAARGVAELLSVRREGEGKPWIVVDPLPALDVSTARLVRSLAESGIDVLVIARVPSEVSIPDDAFGRASVRRADLPGLGEEGPRFAAALLGVDEAADAAILVAALGGGAPLAVVEAARALVSRGDLVLDAGRFRLRQPIRPRRASVPLARLVGERLRGLETAALRVLEVIALSPPGTPRAILDRALELDGLGEDRRRDATLTLEREAWITGRGSLLPSSEPVRASVVKSMAPARRVELQSFLARATGERAGGAFARIAAATHARAAGESESAAAALLEAADEAKLNRHVRAALKLAATAVEWSRAPDVRRRAAEIARAEAAAPAAEDASATDDAMRLSARWIAAVRARDFDLADRLVDEGVAEGAPLFTAETLRTWMALARGDAASARELVAAARVDEDLAHDARLELVLGWIDLAEGRPRDAMTRTLSMLARARREGDKAAEGAALSTLSVCQGALGHPDASSALRQLADAAASAARTLRSKSA